MKYLFLFISLTFCNTVYSQNWEIIKDTKNMKVYTSDIKGSYIKNYKIVAFSNASINNVYSLITDYKNYTIMFKEISEFKLLSKNDSVYTTYSLFDMPWPIKKRDLISKINIYRTQNTIIISSKALNKHEEIKKKECIRILDFHEKFILKKVSENQTECTIIGHIDMGGTIPDWAQTMFITKSPPVKLINLIETKNKNK